MSKRYVRIVFMQGEDAEEALGILDERGEEAAVEYLAQWDMGESRKVYDEPASGSQDSVWEDEDGYRLTWHEGLRYIGLEWIERYCPVEEMDRERKVEVEESEEWYGEDM